MKNKEQKFSWTDVWKSAWYFLEEDRTRFVFFFFILLGIFFYELVPTYVVGKIIDFFASYKTGQSLSTFYFYVIFTSITYIIASLIRLKGKNAICIIGQHAKTRARIWGFERLTEFSLEWHNKENTGNKLQRIFTGADTLAGFSRALRRDVLKIAASIIGVAIVFLFTDLKFLVLVVIYTGVFLYVEFTFSKRVLLLSNEFNKLNQSAGGVYVESASNMLSIKALGNEEGMVHRVTNREKISLDLAIKVTNANNLKWRVLQFINGTSLGIFLLLTGYSVISHVVTLGTILVFFNYFFIKLQGSLADLSDLYTELIDLRSGLGQMMPIFKETEFIKTGNESFPKDWQTIEIKNASMDYGSKQIGLHNFSLNLKRNSKIGIAGLSGSGKSTLAKIILGLYALKSGEFKIGGKNYYAISHNETLSNITVVLQETELFNLSLRENITMMREVDQELLNTAIEISQLKEVMGRLPEGLNAKIGEKGYMLSGGERQRLGIARAIYKNASFIILDEATSSLDSETEGKIMEELLGEYGRNKTFLIIAHRLGTLKYTDNIAVMERGQIVEQESYNKLVSDPGSVFYRMNREKKEEENESRD